MRHTRFTCDGCGDQKIISLTEDKPADWKEVQLSWSGMNGYPTNLENGQATYDLCKTCSPYLKEQMNPRNWPRMQTGIDKP